MFYQFTIPITRELNNLANQQGFSIITNIGHYTSSIVGLFLTVAGIAAFIYFVWGGLQWIMSGSDKTKVEEARTRLTNAIIGLGIVAVSWAIFLLLDFFFGLGLVGGTAGTTGTSTSSPSSGVPSYAVCLYPARRCCENAADSTCYCHNPPYHATSYGSCDAGGGQSGAWCACLTN